MAKRLVDCPHCGGAKNCTKSGGRSCKGCLQAAGMGRRTWATVRCAYCGGRGKVTEEIEEEADEGATEEPEAE